MKRKTLTTALLAGLTGSVGIANISNAVNINPDGLGQVLLYPYYTVRNGTDTLVSVVNTTANVKAVKVRFLEGENSREVLDFNLYMSPFDVWTAAVTNDDAVGGARILTTDNSCTVPAIPEGGQQFLRYAYTGGSADGGGTTFDRTREGHIEMIEMGTVHNTSNGSWATDATHVAGVPADCDALVASWNGGYWDTTNSDDGISPPGGGLFGGASLIQVLAGFDVGYNADALDAFSGESLHFAPGSVLPNLNNQTDGFGGHQSIVFNDGGVVTSDWPRGVDAVSALYMHDTIMNEYVLDDATLSGTDWVMNFPTKAFYVDPPTSGSNAAIPPFTSVFDEFEDGTACEPISLTFWDREERQPSGPGLGFSPPAPGPQGNALCWEDTIVTFDNSSVLGSALQENVNPGDVGFQHGWMRISFDDSGNSFQSNDGDVYNGLPVTGFAVQTFTNGTLTDDEGNAVLSNYAGLFGHRNTRDISGT